MSLNRRKFLGAGAIAAGAGLTLGASGIASASEKTFNWKMTNAYAPGSPFYVQGPGSPTDFCKRVETMSNGRLKIQHFAAGELIPALEGFDAVSSGMVEMNAANAFFWAGKIPAAQFFTAVPFGMNTQGMNAWLYNGGALQLWEELYEPHGLVPMPMGNTGTQMTGWFRQPLENVDSLKGLKMRVPGLAGKVYSELGVAVRLLPGGEIFPALERGVIDAAEFVGPFLDARLGLQNAAKNYYASGWHEPSTVSEIVMQRKIWDALPPDLKEIVRAAADATNQEGLFLLEARNADALDQLVNRDKVVVRQLPVDVVTALRKTTTDVLNEAAAKDAMTKKVHESFFTFKKKHDRWSEISDETFLAKSRG